MRCPSRARRVHLAAVNTGARLVRLPERVDHRGSLTFGEVGTELPFQPARYFVMFNLPKDAVRGGHAHRKCHQFIVVVCGACRTVLQDRTGRDELTLDTPLLGIHVPPMTWVEQSEFAPGTVVLVLASDRYDDNDYLRSLTELLEDGQQ